MNALPTYSAASTFYDELMGRLRAEIQGLRALRQLHAPNAE